MKTSKVFDDVILYLETIILDGSEINYEEISKLAMCPAALFQRIFTFVSGISINDYVRKRRLTLAAYDLKNDNRTVLDVAVKYGFQSHSAFTRAFKDHHGLTPSEAKLFSAKVNNYLPMNFSDMRLIGGKRIMAEMKKITYQNVDERLMVGMQRATSFYDAGKVWQEYFVSDTIDQLSRLSEVKECDDIDDNEGIGCMFNFSDEMHFTLILGDFVKVGTKIPEGISSKYIPKGITAQIQIEGNNVDDILDSAYFLITEAIEKTDREIDFDNFYWCEVYTCERYCEPIRRGDKVIIDYIVPVKE